MRINRIVLAALLALFSLTLVASLAWAKSKDRPKPEVAKKAFLGVYLQDIDEDTQEALDLQSAEGVLVEGVADGSAADKAGLKEQDVIISFNGQEVDDSDELQEVIAEHKAGDNVKIKVLRDGEEKVYTAELGKSQDIEDFEISIPQPGDLRTFSFTVPSFNRPRMGVQISDLSQQLGDFFGVKNGEGALVTEVIEESPAEKAGLKAGDVIIRIDDEKIKSSADVHEALEGKDKGDKVNVEVVRDKGTHSLTVTVELEGPTSPKWHADTWNFQAPKMKMKQQIEPKVKIFSDKMEMQDELREELKELRRELKQMQKELEELKEEK